MPAIALEHDAGAQCALGAVVRRRNAGSGAGAGAGGSAAASPYGGLDTGQFRDNRNLWQRYAPKLFGGKDAPGVAGSPGTQSGPAAGPSGASAYKTPPGERGANMRESIAFWKSKGYSDAAISGLLSQEQSESDFITHNKGDPTATQAWTAGGSFQWHADRRARILAATGIDVYSDSTTHQQMLAAADWELNHSHKSSGDMIRGAKTPYEAGFAGSKYYEGAARKYGADIEAARRGGVAQRFAAKINDSAPVAAEDHLAPNVPRAGTGYRALEAFKNFGVGSAAAAGVHNATWKAMVTARHHGYALHRANNTHIGELHVHSAAKDATGIAKDIKPALNRKLLTTQSDYGPI